MPITFYHNPRCSKSCQALELASRCSSDVKIINYLTEPPSHNELENTLGWLGIEPHPLMHTKEPDYTELGLGNGALTRADLVDAMVRHPRLIERPIVMNGDRVIIGRPPEKILEIR